MKKLKVGDPVKNYGLLPTFWMIVNSPKFWMIVSSQTQNSLIEN